MNRFRPLLTALLGLLLLIQGYATASALRPMAAMESPELTVAVAGELPCHGQVAEDGESQCPCCDGQCPDMTMCAMGQVALPATLDVVLPRQTSPAPDFPSATAITRSPISLLRPPITLQG